MAIDTDAAREQIEKFRSRVDALIEQVEVWIDTREWVTKRYPKRMRGGDRQVFEIPAFFLQKGATRILLDPIAFDVPGTECVVDLYLMPTYDDLASLFLQNGNWTIQYPLPAPTAKSEKETRPVTLDKDSLNQVLESIATHAKPSI